MHLQAAIELALSISDKSEDSLLEIDLPAPTASLAVRIPSSPPIVKVYTQGFSSFHFPWIENLSPVRFEPKFNSAEQDARQSHGPEGRATTI